MKISLSVLRRTLYSQKHTGYMVGFMILRLDPNIYLDREECIAFFRHISSQKYGESLKHTAIQFVIKVGHGVHKSDGVFLLDRNQTKYMLSKYHNAALCGKIQDHLLAQAYVSNPLLLDMNNKFDFRVYMLIASTNPLIVYYRDGLLKASLYSYEKNSTEVSSYPPSKKTLTYLRELHI